MKYQKGFTLIEIILVMSILFILFGFTTLSFVKQQNSVSVQSITDSLVSDINSAQNKAMLGDSNASYGIYFQPDRYVLFAGSSYSQNNPSNFIVNIDPGYQISNVTFSNNTVIFASGSGEVNGYALGSDSLKIQNANGSSSRTIKLNRYGVIIEED